MAWYKVQDGDNCTYVLDDKVEDLTAYIMGLWDQQKRFRMIRDYKGAIKLRGNPQQCRSNQGDSSNE